MKQVRFEFEELPYETLSQFGLTREMIEDFLAHLGRTQPRQALACIFPSNGKR